MIRIGCCGFAGARASYYGQFRLVEVQQTFYEPPCVGTVERWRAEAPADFEFTLKAWQLITHEASSPTYRRLRRPLPDASRTRVGSFRPTDEVWRAWERTRDIAHALRAKVIVFQCPASFKPTRQNQANLREFFGRIAQAQRLAPAAFTLVWEPRGQWADAGIAALCAELGLVHGVDPFARLPVTREWFYFRLHGLTGYTHRYSDAELERLEDMFRGFAGGYCLFNNVAMREDAARLLRRLLARQAGSR